MPTPSTSLATLRPDLAGSFMAFDLEMQRRGYIATRVLPVLEVMKSAGTFGIIALKSLLQNRTTTRAAGGGYNRGTWNFDDVAFATKENGFEEPVDDRESGLYREYFDIEMIATMRAFEAVLQNAEKRAAAMLFNATTWASATNCVNEWDDFANATPIDNVEAAVKVVWNASGLWPNALVINRRVFRNLRNCAQIIDRINSAGAGSSTKPSDITAEQLAAVFDLEEVIVAGTAKNTANEGQTPVIAPIWSDEYAMVARVARTNDIKEPCVGRTFHWSEDGSEAGGTVETYRDEKVRSDIVRVRHDTDEKILYVAAAQLLDNVTT